MPSPLELETLEIDLLLQAVYEYHGHDFRHYARASITRRLRQHLTQAGVATIADLIPLVLHDPRAFHDLASTLSLTVTEMFRDPSFFWAVRDHVLPLLRTYPFVNIWHAGCATGEEVYSLAIVLLEEGLYDRCRLYATDFNDDALQTARNRIYPIDRMVGYATNYGTAGGRCRFADYFHASMESAILSSALQKNVTFANHNLVTDGVFAEMHMILCRNVLIYFDRTLQDRVLSLFRDSLCYQGILCLGRKESLQFSTVRPDFVDLVPEEKVFQHKGLRRASNG